MISLNSTGNDTRIVIVSDVTLTGNGQVQMGDNPNNFIVCNGSPVTLTNAGNTNLGAGLIGDGNLTLVNLADGTIDGNASSGLIIQGGQPTTNAGLEGTSAGPMLIRSVSVANTGTIAAPVASSVVQSASITGGTLKTANGGAILEIDRGSVLSNVTIAPGSNVTVANNDLLSLLGTITNQGTVALASAGNDTRLIPLGAVTLTGGGLITLSDNVNNFELSNFSIAASLVNLDNTISGAGRIGDQGDALLSLTNANKGVIDATGGNGLVIAMGGGTVSNTGGHGQRDRRRAPCVHGRDHLHKCRPDRGYRRGRARYHQRDDQQQRNDRRSGRRVPCRPAKRDD